MADKSYLIYVIIDRAFKKIVCVTEPGSYISTILMSYVEVTLFLANSSACSLNTRLDAGSKRTTTV